MAALAVLAAFAIGVFIYRELPLKELIRVLKDSAGQTAVVMLIVASSAVLGWYLTSEQIPQKFARMILETTSNKYLILLFLNIFFLIAGMFLHSAAAIILIVPIVMPLIRQIGVDPIHFGIIVTINLGVGQQTPPVATVLFTTAAHAQAPGNVRLDSTPTLQASQASTPVPAVAYRSVFSDLPRGVEDTVLDWKAANAAVGQFQRGHADLLKWEQEQARKSAPPAQKAQP